MVSTGLHQIPDEHKIDSLKEIYRILTAQGILYSTSFGYWEGHEMPRSIHPIANKEIFTKIHMSVGFRPSIKVEERSDRIIPYEKFRYGEFGKTETSRTKCCARDFSSQKIIYLK